MNGGWRSSAFRILRGVMVGFTWLCVVTVAAAYWHPVVYVVGALALLDVPMPWHRWVDGASRRSS